MPAPPDPLPRLSRLESAFRRSLERLIQPQGLPGGLLVAISGGADSVCLLELVHDLWLRHERSFPLRLAHFHHGLRGAEADCDASFVRDLARERGIAIDIERLAVSERARERGESPEQAGRELRRQGFARLALRHGLASVLTAHHAADQRETVLFRMLRGTGPRGLGGIHPRSRLGRPGTDAGEIWLLRPLLDQEPGSLREHLRERGLEHREDSSNRDVSIPRNALRHELLPELLERVHPGASRALLRLARSARRLEHDLETLAGEIWSGALRPSTDGEIVLDRRELSRCVPTLRRLLIGRALEESCRAGAPPALTEDRFAELERRLESGSRFSLEFSGSHRVEADRQHLTFTQAARPAPASPPPPPIPGIEPPSRVTWDAWTLRLADHAGPATFEPGGLVELADADLLPPTLELGSRRPGDRFWPLGSGGHKRLQEFFRERGVPTAQRDHVPLLRHGADIVWVVGHRLAHPFRVTPRTRRVVRLEAHLDPPGCKEAGPSREDPAS